MDTSEMGTLDASSTNFDIYSPAKRSEIMGHVRGQNTTPERTVRSMLHRLGYRFRLNVTELPGKPDIVLPRHRKVIFVHGCFWHQHPNCPRSKLPKTRADWWKAKLQRNVERDRETEDKLHELGWVTLVIWQCQIRDRDALEAVLRMFMENGGYPVDAGD
jgi:DNA mismatch endonuclease (patch repair protein)